MLTQGTPSCSMILFATVVFPDALPPHKPVGKKYRNENKYMEQWFGSTKAGNKHKGISKKNETLFIYYN